MPYNCALRAQVSTDEQEPGNQLAELRRWAAARGLDVADEYVLDGASAWKGEHHECGERIWAADSATGRELARCRLAPA